MGAYISAARRQQVLERASGLGRVTVRLLQFNTPPRVEERRLLLLAGAIKLSINL